MESTAQEELEAAPLLNRRARQHTNCPVTEGPLRQRRHSSTSVVFEGKHIHKQGAAQRQSDPRLRLRPQYLLAPQDHASGMQIIFF